MLFWLVLSPIIISIIGYLAKSKKSFIWIGLAQVALMVYSIFIFFKVQRYGPIVESLGGYQMKYAINLVADDISTIFVVITCLLFLAMLLFNYHKPYMNKLFLFLFLSLQGLINGIFLSRDLFNLYALIEVSTVVVAILIMYKRDSQSIYDGMVYLLTNLVSMTFFLFGLGYIYKIFGSLDLYVIKENLQYVEDTRSLILPYTFLITAIGLKSALMPLFSWLPRAHGTPSAPSIVSAILSGLYVKGGVYLFLRFQDTFMDRLDTSSLFLALGFFTAVVGFIFAISQTDIKLILAYSTVSQIGLIIFGLSLRSDYSYYGAIYHIVNHAVFKSTLFLAAGMIIEEYETRDIREIHGVFKRMPFVSVVMIIAMLGITGAPLFNGSISKYLIQKGIGYGLSTEYGLLFINLGTIVCYIKYSHMLLGDSKPSHPVRLNQKIVIGALASITFISGIFGQFFVNGIFHLDIYISIGSFIEKSLIYCFSLLIGFLFYRYAYKRIRLFTTMGEIELSFNEIIFSIVFFFTGLLAYLMITVN